MTLDSEVYKECAAETDVNGIPRCCLGCCQISYPFRRMEANIPAMQEIKPLNGEDKSPKPYEITRSPLTVEYNLLSCRGDSHQGANWTRLVCSFRNVENKEPALCRRECVK